MEYETPADFGTPEFCTEDACFDEALMDGLDATIEAERGPMVVVLHQQGSHGPAYFRRYPDRFARFTPACGEADLQDCKHDAIVNAYDNTILYTDFFLGEVIRFLREREDRFRTAMIYVSDHGESLGEDRVYLHGLPYFMAPDSQTHVPWIVWLSDSFRDSEGIDGECLRAMRGAPLSHDNLFHSLLGLMDVSSEVYRGDLDPFATCRDRGRGAPEPPRRRS